MSRRAVSLRPFRLRLVQPVRTAHGLISDRTGWLVRLVDEDGVAGLGEATPLPGFGTEDLADCTRALEALAEKWLGGGTLSGNGGTSVPLLGGPVLPPNPCAHAAFAAAMDDLEARRRGVSAAQLLVERAGRGQPGAETRSAPNTSIRVQALVGGASAGEVTASVRGAKAQGFEAFKLKVARAGDAEQGEADRLAEDLARVAALREAAGPQATLRLDANGGWSRDAAEAAVGALASFGIDYIEQPVAADDLAGLAALSASSPIPVAADEALLGEGLARVARTRAARVWIVKPAALGGSEAALGLARLAATQDVRIVWSSLLDGAVSCAAAAHLAAALGTNDSAQGLGTGPLIESDFEGGPVLVSGSLRLSAAPGLGFDVDRVFEAEGAPFLGPARDGRHSG